MYIRCSSMLIQVLRMKNIRDERAHQGCQKPLMWCQTWHAATKRDHSTLPQSETGRGPACSESGTAECALTYINTTMLNQDCMYISSTGCKANHTTQAASTDNIWHLLKQSQPMSQTGSWKLAQQHARCYGLCACSTVSDMICPNRGTPDEQDPDLAGISGSPPALIGLRNSCSLHSTPTKLSEGVVLPICAAMLPWPQQRGMASYSTV